MSESTLLASALFELKTINKTTPTITMTANILERAIMSGFLDFFFTSLMVSFSSVSSISVISVPLFTADSFPLFSIQTIHKKYDRYGIYDIIPTSKISSLSSISSAAKFAHCSPEFK